MRLITALPVIALLIGYLSAVLYRFEIINFDSMLIAYNLADCGLLNAVFASYCIAKLKLCNFTKAVYWAYIFGSGLNIIYTVYSVINGESEIVYHYYNTLYLLTLPGVVLITTFILNDRSNKTGRNFKRYRSSNRLLFKGQKSP